MSDRPFFVITGTGRSGTTYLAAALRVCGVRCGHQSVLKHETTVPIDTLGYDGDVSYEAVPHLPQLPVEWPTVLVVREPLATVRSMRELGWFDPNMSETHPHFWRTLKSEAFGGILDAPTPLLAAVRYWCTWNLYAREFADMTVRLEDLDTATLPAVFDHVGYGDCWDSEAVSLLDADLNHRRRDRRRFEVRCNDLPADEYEHLAKVAATFGYDL